jgi:hypothetical protein
VSSMVDPPSRDSQVDAERFETEQVNGLLIEELSLWGETLSQNEASGEGRVTIFLAAVGAAATALPVVIERQAQLGRAVLPILFGFLLFLGLFTLFRLVKRNLETDRCITRLWLIRSYFKEKYSSRLPSWGYPEGIVSDPSRKSRRRNWLSFEFVFGQGGGHVELVEWANAILFGLLAYGVVAGGDEWEPRALITAIVLGFLFRAGEFAWVNWMYQRKAS